MTAEQDQLYGEGAQFNPETGESGEENAQIAGWSAIQGRVDTQAKIRKINLEVHPGIHIHEGIQYASGPLEHGGNYHQHFDGKWTDNERIGALHHDNEETMLENIITWNQAQMEMKRPSAGQIAKGRLEAAVQAIEERRNYILEKNEAQTAKTVADHQRNAEIITAFSNEQTVHLEKGNNTGTNSKYNQEWWLRAQDHAKEMDEILTKQLRQREVAQDKAILRQGVSDREHILKMRESTWMPQNTHYGEEVKKKYFPKAEKIRRDQGAAQKATPSWQVIASGGFDTAITWLRNEHRWRWRRRHTHRIKLFRQRKHDKLTTAEDEAQAARTMKEDEENPEIPCRLEMQARFPDEFDHTIWRNCDGMDHEIPRIPGRDDENRPIRINEVIIQSDDIQRYDHLRFNSDQLLNENGFYLVSSDLYPNQAREELVHIQSIASVDSADPLIRFSPPLMGGIARHGLTKHCGSRYRLADS
jgi:hypothetical protein